MTVLIEEMSELTKTICKIKRQDGFGMTYHREVEDMIGEIADVLIMIEQISVSMKIDFNVGMTKDQKVNALEHRLNKWLLQHPEKKKKDKRVKVYRGVDE